MIGVLISLGMVAICIISAASGIAVMAIYGMPRLFIILASFPTLSPVIISSSIVILSCILKNFIQFGFIVASSFFSFFVGCFMFAVPVGNYIFDGCVGLG